MSRFALEEVSRLVGLTPKRIRDYVRTGLLQPQTGPDGPTFGFQDLVLLKNARRLLEQGVSPKKVQLALAQLRHQLEQDEPLSAVGLVAQGRRLIAERGERRWDALSGQAIFGFQPSRERGGGQAVPLPSAGRRSKPPPSVESLSSAEWVELGRDLELHAPHQARDAYRRALELAPDNLTVQLRLAALLERTGHHQAAAAHYRLVLTRQPDEPTARDRLRSLERRS